MLHGPAWELRWLVVMPVLGLNLIGLFLTHAEEHVQLVCNFLYKHGSMVSLWTNHGLLAHMSVLGWKEPKSSGPSLAASPHCTPFSHSDHSHNTHSIHLFMVMNNCHLSLAEGELYRGNQPAWNTGQRLKGPGLRLSVGMSQALNSVAN